MEKKKSFRSNDCPCGMKYCWKLCSFPFVLKRRLYNIAESRGLGDYQNCLYEGGAITKTQRNLQEPPLALLTFFFMNRGKNSRHTEQRVTSYYAVRN